MTTSPGRALLTAQHTQLLDAIAVGTDPFALAHAKRLVSRAETWLFANTDYGLDVNIGLFGPNGWQPGIDDVCQTLLESGEVAFREALA